MFSFIILNVCMFSGRSECIFLGKNKAQNKLKLAKDTKTFSSGMFKIKGREKQHTS